MLRYVTLSFIKLREIILIHICSKLAKVVDMIKVARLYIPHTVLLSMFHAFIMSYLRNGVLIWGNTFSTYKHRVSVLYSKAIRDVLSLPPTAHILSLLNKLQILSVNDIYLFNSCIFMYRVKHFMLLIEFCNMCLLKSLIVMLTLDVVNMIFI